MTVAAIPQNKLWTKQQLSQILAHRYPQVPQPERESRVDIFFDDNSVETGDSYLPDPRVPRDIAKQFITHFLTPDSDPLTQAKRMKAELETRDLIGLHEALASTETLTPEALIALSNQFDKSLEQVSEAKSHIAERAKLKARRAEMQRKTDISIAANERRTELTSELEAKVTALRASYKPKLEKLDATLQKNKVNQWQWREGTKKLGNSLDPRALNAIQKLEAFF